MHLACISRAPVTLQSDRWHSIIYVHRCRSRICCFARACVSSRVASAWDADAWDWVILACSDTLDSVRLLSPPAITIATSCAAAILAVLATSAAVMALPAATFAATATDSLLAVASLL